MAYEATKIVSAMYVERDSPWTALVALGTTRLPHTAGESSIDTPSGDVQATALASDGLLGAVSRQPNVGLLGTQPQQPPQRRHVQPFVVRYHPWCFCDPFIVISSLPNKYTARVL